MRLGLVSGLVLSLTLGGACGGGDDDGGGGGTPDAGQSGDLADVLAAIPGMTVTEETIDAPYRFFHLEYEQPVDHDQPDGATFHQRMTLLHRDADAPMILHTTGYHLYEQPFLSEVGQLLDANQIHVEQRYFGPSRPDPTDWSYLTIEQAAADHHRIVQALAPLYPGAWVSTGASKGGMTSIFHRRFYPDDVAATVAYVAPISHAAPDDSYEPFFDTVGGAACRQAVEDYQHEMLVRRDVMLAKMETFATEGGFTYERMGGIENAFEDSVVEFEWGYWQYLGEEWCPYVPATDAGDDEMWDFHVQAGSLDLFDDAGIADYEPYYYQSETQLGYPSEPTDQIDDLLVTQDEPRDYLPGDDPVTFNPAPMEDIASWVASDSDDKLLLIYGEWDPWTAGAFDLGDAQDSFRFTVTHGTHGSQILALEPADQETAFDALERWTGVTPVIPQFARARRLPGEPAVHGPL